MFLPVPWATDGGALNTPEAARLLAYVGSSGNQGVVGMADLKVSAQPVPDATLRVATGAGIVPCRSAGYAYQSYAISRPLADDFVPVPANGGASDRYDMIVARVENPHLSSESWPMPPNVALGPYVFPRRVACTAADIASRGAARKFLRLAGMSAIPLAGVTMPAGANSVLDGYLVDLRNVANPRTYRAPKFTYSPPSGTANVPGAWGDWIGPTAWQVDVPEWTNRLSVVATVQARADKQSGSVTGKVYGQLRIRLGTDGDAVTTQAVVYDFDAPASSGATRVVVLVADTITVPAAYRDTRQPIRIQGDELGGNQPLFIDDKSIAVLEAEFTETAS